MSCLGTPEERHAKEVNQQIQRDLKKHKRDLKNTKKLLLLGTGESGKTTFIKQMRILHGKPYSQDELDNFRILVYRNIYIAVQVLVDAMETLGLQYEQVPEQTEMNRICEIDYENPPEHLPPADYSFIKNYWKDRGRFKNSYYTSVFHSNTKPVMLDCKHTLEPVNNGHPKRPV